MDARTLALALRARHQSDGSWLARCPAHNDRTPSLHISAGAEGRLLLKCFGGCTFEAIRDAARARGIWHDAEGAKYAPRPKRVNGHHAPELAAPEPSTAAIEPILPVPEWATTFDPRTLTERVGGCWDYLDSKGRLLGYVVRADRPDGGKEWVKPVVWTAGGWRAHAFPAPRPLYGLAELAERPDAPVLIVEGEKTACAARELFADHVCMTWPGGSSAVDKADWRRLKGRRVAIWPDADEPGAKAAQAVAAAVLAAGALDARIVALPSGLPKGWDLADPIPPGIDIGRLLEQARDVRAARLNNLKLISGAALMTETFKEPNWAIPGILPEGAAMLAGKPKVGKSWLALDYALAVAGGQAAMGSTLCEQPGPVLYIGLEDTERRLQGRIKAVLQDRPMPHGMDFATEWKAADAGGLDDIRLWLEVHRDARLVIIDTLARMRGRSDRHEGVYQNDVQAIVPFKKLADEFNVTILLIHHLRKEKSDDPLDSISGSAGITGALDTALVLKREPNSPNAVLYVRGRDVHEHEIAMQHDAETGRWLKLGNAEDFRRSEQRRAVFHVLNAATKPLKPTEIAQALGKQPAMIRQTLARMVAAGDLAHKVDDNTYRIAGEP